MSRETTIFQFHKAMMTGYAEMLLNYNLHMEEPLPAGPKLLIANHPTTTDPFLLPLLLDEPVSILVTQLAFDVPLLGRLIRAGGHIPVPVERSGSGAQIVPAAVAKLRAGGSVSVFIEGSLSPAVGQFCPPRTGAARMALLSGAAVIPVGIHLSQGAYLCTHYKVPGRVACRGAYYVTTGRALHFAGDAEDRDQVREVARQMMQAVIEQAGHSADRMRADYNRQVPALAATGG